MSNRVTTLLTTVFVLTFSCAALAQGDNYIHVSDDLQKGTLLQDIAERAYENADEYWESASDATRDGDDEVLSAGEAVTEIYTNAAQNRDRIDPMAGDIVEVTLAVIDAWPNCEDTFEAVRSAVSLVPGRADEIVARVAVKRDCNCSNGGLWLDQRVGDRIRVDMRHKMLEVPVQCSCSQVAMYAGVAGLPENLEFDADLDDTEKAELVARMTEKVTTITERTSALQNRNDWECGCAEVNIAATMQGIGEDELRDGTYEGLAVKYADEAGDTGIVVDSFGVIGLYPMEHWGENAHMTRDNTLRRNPGVYRGDNLLLDPFDPSAEFTAHGDRQLDEIQMHTHTSANQPTDLIISEYIEGWNEKALNSPEADRDPEHRNRVVELYNGTDETIDLGADQYFLEIYAGPGSATTKVATPPALVRKTISLESDVTFEFDKADIQAAANEDLRKVVKVLNEVDLFSEVLIVGYTCDMGPDDYNLALSTRRAESVKDFFIDAGLNVPVIRTEGHGEMDPRVANSSPENRSLNRRIEITFVTKQGEVLEPVVVSEGDDSTPARREYTFMVPAPGSVVNDVASTPVQGAMADGEYYRGKMEPRQVIGLNGAVKPGETHVIAFSNSDEVLTDAANQVSGELDFKPNESLVVRRLGGAMALNCRAQSYSYVTNYPVIPIFGLSTWVVGDDAPDYFSVASPN